MPPGMSVKGRALRDVEALFDVDVAASFWLILGVSVAVTVG